MSLEPCVKVIPTIIQGEDKVLTIRLNDSISGDPTDLTAASEIEAAIGKTDGSTLRKKLSDGGISLVSGPGGKFQVLLTAAETLLLKVSPTDEYSNIEVSFVIAGKKTIVQLEQVVKIKIKLFAGA